MPMRMRMMPMDFWESLKEWLKARNVIFTHWAYLKNWLTPTVACRVSSRRSRRIKKPAAKLMAGVRKIITTTLPQK